MTIQRRCPRGHGFFTIDGRAVACPYCRWKLGPVSTDSYGAAIFVTPGQVVPLPPGESLKRRDDDSTPPINPISGQPYFQVQPYGWGGGWSADSPPADAAPPPIVSGGDGDFGGGGASGDY